MMPTWSSEIVSTYKCDAANQFIVYGNVRDKLLLPLAELGTLDDYFLLSLFGPFDVVLVYDVGNGLRCMKGSHHFGLKPDDYPRQPKQAIDTITEYLRHVGNQKELNGVDRRVAVVIKDANLVCGASSAYSFDANATASLIRDWSTASEFTRYGFATFLVTENINDLHPLLSSNDRAARILIPVPQEADLKAYFNAGAWKTYARALSGYDTNSLAPQLVGMTLVELETRLKIAQQEQKVLNGSDIVKLKKQAIEKQADGLIEFIESERTLDDLIGQDEAKKAIREHLTLWKQNDNKAIPMGYLFAAPVGVGKNFLVECIAGEAGVPVVLVKNFRTKWVGDTESKQEKIIRLIRSLGRCFVFFDEADATLGKRESGDGDSGLSQRIYSLWATEMSNPKNRGRIVWLLASSRADRIEIDLKRPGRIDIIIPLFPSASDQEGFRLLQGLCKREGIEIPDSMFSYLTNLNVIPKWLTAGAAESIAKKAYVKAKTKDFSNMMDGFDDGQNALASCLVEYQPAVPLSKMEEQIRIAANNCTDVDFIPEVFRKYRD